ncbi:Putative CDP-diacylglycerol--serine O-phosphatidyltransferase [Mycobacteroides abscessus subsp. massiliense]|uniref:CDP-diacylglycerol--serine O-phosphatidyltransferase n=1 Tax=Mycobacteroides abscessus TaxID=36809 RepID=UPI0002E0CA06|nr:CDP-diacylglycerol--serine O-phosphatidyltransferase [Mycobacteroides abscessus]AMU29639.1 CDP-diacylglycerol--serine O-phosphatidyltransferase [Mycobacteroides abscessus]ANN97817.1 CDP-diacylglycerol--serine O-phosphatidyltransferase [Mycobacteroides abscessus]MBN7324528.1 CDP-diacylglycerol--serine O-phosphatidyltransferase [Mycobacteroides abscessus subsp. massiliense]MDM2645992.1 CDP-diacylglycerol--serine O-phosphatidyltransferase [Mycobacteroides abscessus]MDM2656267.1 CDP-diacylglyce
MISSPVPKRPVHIRILPSVMTVLAICGGLSSIKFAFDGKPYISLTLIAAAAILDGLDGRIARLLDATSRMGAEIDSLADAVNFGVAPAVVLYISMLADTPTAWVFSLLYAVCIVLRLARFNTLLDDDTAPAFTKEYFVGVPSPAGALMVMAPLAAYLQFGDGWWSSVWAICGWMVFVSMLIVSQIPTAAMKSVSVPPRMVVLLLALVTVAAALLLQYPYVLLLVLIVVYLTHIPFAWRSQRWVAARPESWDAKPKERRDLRRDQRRDQRRAFRQAALPKRRTAERLGLRRPGRPR